MSIKRTAEKDGWRIGRMLVEALIFAAWLSAALLLYSLS